MNTTVIVAPNVRDLETLSRQLADWMAPRVPGASDVRVEYLSYPNGAGLSHETILFDASWTEGGRRVEQGCVVRIKPTDHVIFREDLFEPQYLLMRYLSESGRVPVARPLWLETDPGLLGAPFFVMQKVKGRVPVSYPPYNETGWLFDATPAQRRKVWENGMKQMAAVQSIPLADVPFLAGPEGARSGLEQEWDKYVRYVRWVTESHPSPVLDAALDALEARWPKNQPPGVVWGDARIGNIMYDDNFEVVAVMDWEQPSLGGALQDLAWWLTLSELKHGALSGRPPMEGMGTREETLALWRELTGLSTDDIEWYEDFTLVKIACTSVRTSELRGHPMPDHAGLAKRLKLNLPA